MEAFLIACLAAHVCFQLEHLLSVSICIVKHSIRFTQLQEHSSIAAFNL